MGKRADPHRARGSALCGQWLLLDRKHHETGSALARLCTGSVGTRLGAVGGIKRLAGDKVCENSVLHSWTPFLVGNSHRRFPLASSRPHDVSPGAHVREGRRTRWARILGKGVRRPYGTRGYVFWARVSEGRMGQGGTYFGQGCQKAVWDKGVRYFTRGLQPGTPGSPPGSPGTFRSTPAGNTCSPRDRGAWGTGASGNVKNCFKGRKIIFHFRKKYFSRKNLLGRGYFGEKMCPRFPVYPGWPFLCRLAPGKEKKYRRGYRRLKKLGALFSRVPRVPFPW